MDLTSETIEIDAAKIPTTETIISRLRQGDRLSDTLQRRVTTDQMIAAIAATMNLIDVSGALSILRSVKLPDASSFGVPSTSLRACFAAQAADVHIVFREFSTRVTWAIEAAYTEKPNGRSFAQLSSSPCLAHRDRKLPRR